MHTFTLGVMAKAFQVLLPVGEIRIEVSAPSFCAGPSLTSLALEERISEGESVYFNMCLCASPIHKNNYKKLRTLLQLWGSFKNSMSIYVAKESSALYFSKFWSLQQSSGLITPW